MKKIILAILMLVVVLLIIGFPFYLVILGFCYAATSNFWFGTGLVILGLILLRLIKPISILTGTDFKIF